MLEAGVSRALGREFRLPKTGGGPIPPTARSEGGVPLDSLAEYQGIYAYHGNSSIALVAGTALVAVLDEAKYPLRRLGRDLFLNGVGDTIPFRRAPDGAVSGFVERGTFFARQSAAVDRETLHCSRRGRGAPNTPILCRAISVMV